MKKRRLRKWVENLLMLLSMMSFIALVSDSDNLEQFIIIHIIALIIFMLSNYILYKYSDLFER